MKKNTEFRVKFWGVRGSHPVPGETTTRYGGNTSCVEVTAGKHTIILDAGTGIIGLGQALALQARQTGEPVKTVLLFSHLHHDHTQGFPFFTPAYFSSARLDIFVPDMYERDPELVLLDIMSAPTFPVAFQQTGAEKQVHSLRPTQMILLNDDGLAILSTPPFSLPDDAVTIQALRSYAHPQGVMIYKVRYQGKSVVYASDTEGYINGDQRLAAFAGGADLLIHDAQYTEEHYIGKLAGAPVTQGFGHSTAAMACKIAEVAKVGQLVLFHHDPGYTDKIIGTVERDARTLFSNTVAAREGQVVDLGTHNTQPQALDTLSLTKIGAQSAQDATWACT